ncbi:MarR family winged helix-turn-helix transcriptional regulator [Amycolatopsis granulosa]|uniref:MarR family winged helix-turn-helix transcriptional regulator n=1 Tax=Amycolatopsis granulosa TaxID=185684 RepID=UPI001424581D|nr:MarR family transcriptional regulator [Amycolatopsis granulosa]NIH88485.1 DNA-binding MarR family transcriptional regulator [Amycolatopsis granulosa]
MTAEPAAPDELDYLTFVDYAIAKTTAELPAVDATAMRLGLTLHRLTSALVYDWESTVHRPRGWSWGGFRVLFVLWLAGPMEAKRVAQLSGMSRAAVSALVNTLERDGLVSRRQAEHDRRAVLLDLTEAGHEAITSAYEAHNQREQAWANALTKPEQTILIGLLEKLTTSSAALDAKRRF